MLGKQFLLLVLFVLLLPADVPGQKIVWGAVKGSQCSNPNVAVEGERIILNVVLNTSQSNASDWPLHQIYLEQYSYITNVDVSICDINITRDGCHGPRQGWCGYCDSQVGDLYNLVFNITVLSSGRSSIPYLIKWTSSSSLLSSIYSSFYLTVSYDYPYTTTRVRYNKEYSVQDILNNNFVVRSESTSLFTFFTNPGNISWRYSDQSEDSISSYLYSTFIYNTLVWNSHIDDVIEIKFIDQCPRNWSFTVPVTNLPEFVCDPPPELYGNRSTGFLFVTRCRIPRSRVIGEGVQQFRCYSYGRFPYLYEYGNMTIEGDIFTCTINIPSNTIPPNTSATLYIEWSPVIDIQFTNGSGQNPRVVRFNVNGARSIFLKPGEDVSFECKVYGNPTAVAVLVGTGLGRIQEERSDTDLLLTTLAKVQCEDSGRYTCKGVSGFGSTPGDRQAHVDVNVRCPPAVRSHMPSDINRKFNFDPGSNIVVTLEVYGYPVPTDFGLQLGQGSLSSEVDKDRYSVSSVELNPSLAMLTLIIFSRDNGGPETYVFRISNGANSNLDFQFKAGEFETGTVTSAGAGFVRFNVNGSTSVIAQPGEDVSFECKVYGNPTAVAVLVGTGLGRIQEERSDTDLLLTTLAKVQCEDSGRYTCKGVSGFGSTPGDSQAFVDVNVRCPPAVRSHVPSDTNRKFNFDPGSNILVTLEVYGYPVPTDVGLQLGQGSSFSEVDKDQYSVSTVELNPSLAMLILMIFSRDNVGPETYVFRISNGANSSLDFQFEAGKSKIGPSPWMYAFIAVIYIVAVLVIAVIVIFIIKKRAGTAQNGLDDTRLPTTSALRNGGQTGGQPVPRSRHQTASPATTQPDRSQPTTPQPGRYQPATTQPDRYQPATTQPDRYQPATTQLGRYQPATTQPDRYQPATTQPDRYQPATTQPGRYQPATTQPGRHQPATTQPGRYQPATTQPDRYQPTSQNPRPDSSNSHVYDEMGMLQE